MIACRLRIAVDQLGRGLDGRLHEVLVALEIGEAQERRAALPLAQILPRPRPHHPPCHTPPLASLPPPGTPRHVAPPPPTSRHPASEPPRAFRPRTFAS